MSPPRLILAPNSHGGIGWPTGPVIDPRTGRENNQVIYDLMGDGAPTLLLEPESRWHYTEAVGALPNSLVIWRCVPQPGKRPAEIGWDGARLAEHVFGNMQWHVENRGGILPRDITLINEPSLNYERGDSLNDTDPATWAYVIENSANIQGAARHWLQKKYGLQDSRFWFSAWSPGHGHWDHLDKWKHVAASFDGIIFHEYGMADWIEAEYNRYREVFGYDIPLLLGEYNTDPNVFPGGNDEDARHEEEKVIKDRLYAIRQADPNFAATYFIMRWDGGDRRYMDIDGHPRRRALWPFPAVEASAPLPEPVPVPEPEPEPALPVPVEPAPVEPVPVPPLPVPVPSGPNPWLYWSAEQIARVAGVPLENVQTQWPKVTEQLGHAQIYNRNVSAAVIATMTIETMEFYPVKEGYYLGEPEPAESFRRTLRYFPWYGRGDVQLTFLKNYELYSRKINELWQAGGVIDFVADPELALDPDHAAAVLALWFRDTRALPSPSWPGGYSLIDAANAHDWEWCRILVQGGTAKLEEFSAIADGLIALNAPAEPEPWPLIWDATPLRAEEIAARYGTRAIWFWQWDDSMESLPNLAANIKRQGYDAIYIKAGNGGYASPESGSVRWPKQWNATFINAFRAAGLKVVPWVYLYAYGKDSNGDTWMGPTAEADMLPWVRQVYRDATGEDCPVILDAEYELINQQQGCAEFAQRVKEHGIPRRDLSYAPDFRIAFGNRWPTVRQVRADGGNFPWATFNDLCGYVMPQTYYHMFELSLQEGSYALCDAWQAGFPGLDIPVVPIFDQGPDIADATKNALDGGYPSISVWAYDPAQQPLVVAPAPDPEPEPEPEPVEPDMYFQRPDLDETGPNAEMNAKPRYFQVINEGVAAWHHSLAQFQANYWVNCGPIAMAHAINMIRWRQNNPTTLNAGDAVEVANKLLPESVILQTTDPSKPEWMVPAGTLVYGDGGQGLMTYSVYGLAAYAKLATGMDMIVQSTEHWMPGPALSWEAALEIAKTRPIVVNKPGHISLVIRDKSGRELLWLVQGNIGPSFNGDGGALTAANWGQWNWQTWYPIEPVWGVTASPPGEELTDVQKAEYEARIAQLTVQVADLENRQSGLVTGLGLASGDYADALVNSAQALGVEAKRLDPVIATLGKLTSAASKEAATTAKSVQARVVQIATGEIMPVVGALRGLKPPAS